MKRALSALAIALALVVATRPILAQTEGEDHPEYAITPEAGAWMICVSSFTGPEAKKLANAMVEEIRSRYKVPAYVFNRGEDERRKQREYIEKMRQLMDQTPGAHIRLTRIEEQCAVLVGGYKDIDTARRNLDSIKKWKPPENKRLMPGLELTAQAKLQEGQKAPLEKTQMRLMNPFVASFVVHNPTVPLEKPKEQPDKFLKDLNAGRPYNLFACKYPWTMAVKEFTGASAMQSRSSSGTFLEMLGFGKKSGELLNASALQAEEVAKVLRELKFDAYVLHTRYSSVVTVGGFNDPSDPTFAQLQKKLANAQFGPIQLFANPLPMRVPKE